MKRRAYLHLDHHLGVDIGLTNNIAKFFKINFPFVFLEIQLSTCFKQKKFHLVIHQNGLVHYLLQLGVLQVVPHHHLQHLEELSIGYEPVIVHVVDP